MEYLREEPQFAVTTLGLVLVGGVAILYALNPTALSLDLFFLIPVALTAWFGGRKLGIFMALASATAWLIADGISKPAMASSFIASWNALTKLGLFGAVAWTLPSLRKEHELERESTLVDYLTKAASKRTFENAAEMEIRRAQRYHHPFTLAYLDVDKFKFVNDRFGHNSGDTLLRVIAQTIRNKTRSSDLIARVGSDEFALLLPETQSEAAQIVVRRLQGHLLDAVQKNEWPVSFSFGVATFIRPPDSVQEMIAKADGLMQAAKVSGGNTVRHEVVGAIQVPPETTA